MIAREELVRLGVTLSPALFVTAFGCFMATVSAMGFAFILGGGIALGLTLVGGLLIAATAQSPLHFSAFAALASFLVRIGGAGIAAVLLINHPYSNLALGALAGCLLATLGLDLWTWSRVAQQSVVSTTTSLTSAKESARA
jgi:asparagine N-glycosylation enzyme membrane subunit Stt3